METSCYDIDIEEDEFIQKIQITYDSEGINYISITKNNGWKVTRGQPTARDKEFVSEFSSYLSIAGFVGYEKGVITALGAYRYMCNEPPKKEEEEGTEQNIDIIVDTKFEEGIAAE